MRTDDARDTGRSVSRYAVFCVIVWDLARRRSSRHFDVDAVVVVVGSVMVGDTVFAFSLNEPSLCGFAGTGGGFLLTIVEFVDAMEPLRKRVRSVVPSRPVLLGGSNGGGSLRGRVWSDGFGDGFKDGLEVLEELDTQSGCWLGVKGFDGREGFGMWEAVGGWSFERAGRPKSPSTSAPSQPTIYRITHHYQATTSYDPNSQAAIPAQSNRNRSNPHHQYLQLWYWRSIPLQPLYARCRFACLDLVWSFRR